MDNRIAMIIGGIIGDVYGAQIEMMPLEFIYQKYGKNYLILVRSIHVIQFFIHKKIDLYFS